VFNALQYQRSGKLLSSVNSGREARLCEFVLTQNSLATAIHKSILPIEFKPVISALCSNSEEGTMSSVPKLCVVILAALFICGSGLTVAEQSVSIDQPVPSADANTIHPGRTVVFPIRLTNLPDTGNCAYAFSLNFRVYSPDGAEWVADTVLDSTWIQVGEGYWEVDSTGYIYHQPVMDTLFDELFYDFAPWVYDGPPADSLAVAAIKILSDGLHHGFDDIAYNIRLAPSISSEGLTICIDTVAVMPLIPGADFMWTAVGSCSDVIPDWNGPYCFTIGPCSDLDGDGICAPFDNCPGVANPEQADNDGNGSGNACCCGEYTGGLTGNVDCDIEGKINLSDITRLIDVIYVNKTNLLCCPANANVNGDPDQKLNLADITRLIDHVYVSKAPVADCESYEPGVTGSIIDHSACKSNSINSSQALTDSTQDCIDWSYDGSNVLTLKHINAGFNCCPIIAANISIAGDTILIDEIDSLDNGGCSCLCLFDVDYEIVGLSPGEYRVVIEEPYRPDSDAVLDIWIDLESTSNDSACVSRSAYPWSL
jgi:hypothetical protein